MKLCIHNRKAWTGRDREEGKQGPRHFTQTKKMNTRAMSEIHSDKLKNFEYSPSERKKRLWWRYPPYKNYMTPSVAQLVVAPG